MSKQQHFGWFLSRGFGPQGWGKDYYDWGYDWTSPRLYQEGARYLEQAGFEFLLIEDALSLGTETTTDLRIRSAYGGPKHDPLALTPFLLAATSSIGIVPTLNVASLHPYTAARHLATLQHLGGDRLGLNLVTDVGSARHLGQETLTHDAAYRRAQEWWEAVTGLWRSWGEGALIQNESTGVFADASRLSKAAFDGEFFRGEGPLNAVPQHVEPALFSPGGSGVGFDFAGANAQVRLAMAGTDIAKMAAQRQKLRDAAVLAGRREDDVQTLFVLKPVIAASQDEARARIEASRTPSEAALAEIALGLSSDLDTDLTRLDLDARVDPAIFGDHVSRGTIAQLLGAYPDFSEASLRQLLAQRAALRSIDEGGTVATAGQLVDFIDRAGLEANNDGFLFSGDLHPVTLHQLLDDVVPALRRRGILARGAGEFVQNQRAEQGGRKVFSEA